MANISAIKLPDGYTYTIVDNTSGWTKNTGTVTSVRVQATSPVQSSTSTAQSASLNTTISLADAYGDTKNPYGTKTANYVLAGPTSGSATAPTFRALVAADIPIADWAKANTKPSYNFSEIGNKPTTVGGYGITNAYTKTEIDTLITNLPEPMIFKGSLGTGGTITTLPTAAAANEGYTYKVITAGTYASQTAKIGDTFISDGSNWILIPSGDEPSGTVTSVKVQGSNGLTGSGTVTDSGTITISHATGTGISSSNSGRTYIQSVTLDSYGHVTGLTTATETVTNSDTKNTAGSNDTSNKIFLVGTTSQTTGSNALQTYSHDTAYVGTDGCLYSGGNKVLTSHQSLANYVPTSRTVNGKALSSDISLTAADVGALPSDTTIPTIQLVRW